MTSIRMTYEHAQIHPSTPRSRAISWASLSPRPERQTTIASSGGRAAASSIALATACELSKAGRMPSLRARASKAARASSSGRWCTDPARLFPIAVLRARARIVQPGGDRVHVGRLAVVVLKDVAEAAVEHAGPAEAERGGMVARLRSERPPASTPTRSTSGVVDERIEHARRVAAAADAGHDHFRQPAQLLQALRAASPGR